MFLRLNAMVQRTTHPKMRVTVTACGRKSWNAWAGNSITSGLRIGSETNRLSSFGFWKQLRMQSKIRRKLTQSQPPETFEEVAGENHFEFPAYKAADFFEVCRNHHYSDFKAIVKEILEVEAPLSEDLFLKRIVWYFNREKVTNVVQRAYEQQMYGYQCYGIIRRNGSLYLDNGKEAQFRCPGDIERDIKQIAPEELAAGMFEILKQNVTADKSGLSRSLAAQCGVTRVGKAINAAMDSALDVLQDRIIVDGEQIYLKQ